MTEDIKIPRQESSARTNTGPNLRLDQLAQSPLASLASPSPLASHIQPYSVVLIKLLQGVLYQEASKEWDLLLSYQNQIRSYFSILNVTLYLDEQEGYAYLTQKASEHSETSEGLENSTETYIENDSLLPRLIRRAPLSYDVTLLCVLLRERLLQFDIQEKESTRLIISRDEIIELVKPYVAERNDEIKLIAKIDSSIRKIVELGFLKELRSISTAEYEVRRIIKSKINAEQLLEIKKRIITHSEITV